MRRAFVEQPHRLTLQETSLPDLKTGEVRLRSRAIGICGSDLHVLEGKHPFVSYPVYPGHEVVAEVEAVGDGVSDDMVGRRVVLEPSLVCGTCPNCRAGRYNICDTLAVMGFQAPGGMADAFVAPADRLHVLPDDMDLTAAVLVEPTAVATHAARLVGPVKDRDVAVIGAGTIGLLCAQVAKAHAARSVTVVDTNAERRALARDFGFDATDTLLERSFDVAFECVGVAGAMRSAIDAARKGATIAVVGVYGDDPPLQAGLVQDWELRLQGCLMYTGEDYREAIDLLADGAVDAERMVTHRYPLSEIETAFETASARGRGLKVVLEPS